MYEYQNQPHTQEIITRPQEGKIYKFSYGLPGQEVIYQTGDRICPEQDIIIMPIPKEETRKFDKDNRLYVWFQCRICGKLAYGTIHQAKNKNSPRYNPCGCWKSISSSRTGKRTGPLNCQHFIEWAKSPEGRASSSRIGKTIGCKNITYAQQYCREHPEVQSNIGKRTIKYAIEGAKKWRAEHPEEVAKLQRKATEAANKWREENPEQWQEICRKRNTQILTSVKPSRGEQIIIDYCNKNNISFRREVPMEGVLGPKGYPRRLDFIISYKKATIALEVQGAQHYDENHIFNTSSTRYETLTVQEIDKIKEEYCTNHNLPLYKIDARNISTVEQSFIDILDSLEKEAVG